MSKPHRAATLVPRVAYRVVSLASQAPTPSPSAAHPNPYLPSHLCLVRSASTAVCFNGFVQSSERTHGWHTGHCPAIITIPAGLLTCLLRAPAQVPVAGVEQLPARCGGGCFGRLHCSDPHVPLRARIVSSTALRGHRLQSHWRGGWGGGGGGGGLGGVDTTPGMGSGGAKRAQ